MKPTNLLVIAGLTAFAAFTGLPVTSSAEAAENCTSCTSAQANTARDACAKSFGGKSSDYGKSTCTKCKDTGNVYVTCWKGDSIAGQLDYPDKAVAHKERTKK